MATSTEGGANGEVGDGERESRKSLPETLSAISATQVDMSTSMFFLSFFFSEHQFRLHQKLGGLTRHTHIHKISNTQSGKICQNATFAFCATFC